MIAFVILAAILLLGALEWASRQDRLRHVHLQFRADMPLVEPGECVTLRYEVYNTSPFPILSSGLAIRFDDSVRLLEDAGFTADPAWTEETETESGDQERWEILKEAVLSLAD